jgi:hypothetical protein
VSGPLQREVMRLDAEATLLRQQLAAAQAEAEGLRAELAEMAGQRDRARACIRHEQGLPSMLRAERDALAAELRAERQRTWEAWREGAEHDAGRREAHRGRVGMMRRLSAAETERDAARDDLARLAGAARGLRRALPCDEPCECWECEMWTEFYKALAALPASPAPVKVTMGAGIVRATYSAHTAEPPLSDKEEAGRAVMPRKVFVLQGLVLTMIAGHVCPV